MIKKSLAFATLASIAAVSASAQDISAEPGFGTIVLEANFPQDPTSMEVVSGGEIDASASVPGCNGFVAEVPDVRLNFTASGNPSAFPLYIYAVSDGDTTLLINAPDGNWYCNDDGGDSFDPVVIFGPAMTGDYEIWVGSYTAGEYHPAQLHVSELGTDMIGAVGESPIESGEF